MPYTILKVPRGTRHDSAEAEVIGEFADEREARLFAEDAMNCDADHEYIVEEPPPKPDPFPKGKIY